MHALRTRLILAASLVLAIFLGVTGIALDQVFREAARAQVQDRLLSRVYALLAAADLTDDVLVLPRALPDPDYSVPGSGLYARIDLGDGQPLWRSTSMLGIDISFAHTREPGQAIFSETLIAADGATASPGENPGENLFTLSYRVRWELDDARVRDYVVHVAENRVSFDARLAKFRHNLWFWLAAASLMLLAVQGLILAWSLRPLQQLVRELFDIEQGHRDYLSERQPRELQPLVRNLNHLIRLGRQQLKRHRNALADLAHSLKTPLSVLKSSAEHEHSPEALRHNVLDTVSRMDDSLSYQLRKAAAGGATVLAAPTELTPLLERLRNTLLKVHGDKHLKIDIHADPRLAFRADSGDLMEILGNLLDNACKWAKHQITVQARLENDATHTCLIIVVDDDGPGIPVSEREHILERGGRIDEQAPGHGLGLAIVRELVADHYSGELHVGDSPSAGARLTVILRESN